MKERYIVKQGNSYVIRKSINSHLEYFGHYISLEEAVKIRDLLIKHDWNKNIVRCNMKKEEKKYIHKFKTRNGKVKYGIIKRINNKNEFYGLYKNIQEAMEERDLLIQHEWDLENLCSL